MTVSGLGLANNNIYYFFARTVTTINGITLPPSPITIGTLRVDTTKPASPPGFQNLPVSAPSGVFTIQWGPSSNTGPSGLYGYKIRQFTDGSPVPVEIVPEPVPDNGANLN